MVFPFWWVGAAVAALFLAGAFALFGLAMRALAWTVDEVRQTMLPGVVSGFRGWGSEAARAIRESSPRAAAAGGPTLEDLGASGAVGTAAVHRG